jgi:hypothetical protein
MSDSLFGFTSSFIVPTVVSIAVGTTPITSGSNGRLLFDDAGVVGETNGAFWDKATSFLGLGTVNPSNPLHIKGVADVLNIDNAGGRYTSAILSNNGTGKAQWTFDNNTNLVYFGPYSTNGGLVLRSNGADRMTIFGSTGNIGINTTTDAGFKADINGILRVSVATAGSGITLTSTVTGNAGNLIIAPNATAIGTPGDFSITTPNGTRLFIGGNFSTTFTSTSSVTINPQLIVGGNLTVSGGGTSVITTNTLFLGATNNTSTSMFWTTGGSVEAKILWRLNNLGSFGRTDLFLCINNASTSTVATIADAKFGFLSNGNFLVNTTTDAGFKADINGTLRVTGKTSLNGQLDTNQTGSGHAFTRVNDNGTFIRISNWGYGNSSGNTWVGGTEVASALFALNSTTTGFLPPRMTTAQKNAIVSPASGLVVFDTTLNKLCVFTTVWETVTSI